MGGTIILNNAAGRALRRQSAAVQMCDVLDCAGGFHAGDTVYITFRAADGGQYVIATGMACCDEARVRQRLLTPAAVVVSEQGLQLLWP